jgi:hypothetical protein
MGQNHTVIAHKKQAIALATARCRQDVSESALVEKLAIGLHLRPR